jgi:integrator complex subunit 10
MAPAVGDSSTISDEDYLVLRAKDSLKSDPFAAKAWMITAKTLFPDNFAVQVRIVFYYDCVFDIKLHSFAVRIMILIKL